MIAAYQTNPSERQLESHFTLSSTLMIKGVYEARKNDFTMTSQSKIILNSTVKLFITHIWVKIKVGN